MLPKGYKNYIVYNLNSGKIISTGICPDNALSLQEKGTDSFVIEGIADGITQKIINGKIVNKTPEEIEAEKPSEPIPEPFEQQQVHITNKRWQEILDRLTALEG